MSDQWVPDELWAAAVDLSDFYVRCESCGSRAVALLELHAVNFCLAGEPTVANFRCQECLDRDVARIEEIAHSGDRTCSDCGLTIADKSSMIVRLSPL